MNASDLRLLDYELVRMKDHIMSRVSEQIAEARAAQDARFKTVMEGVTALQVQIDELRANATTPEDFAALDEMQATADAFNPFKPATLPPDGVPVDANPGGVPAGGETAPAAGA
jgi:hypothetical protein